MPAPDANRALERTLKLSPFARRTLSARPDLESHLAEWQSRPVSVDEMRAALGPGEDLSTRLRALRARVMLSLLHRDLNGLATLDEVFETMTGLADASILASTEEALRRGFAVHGEPERADTLVVAALGKLGGCELNVSSDVDLIFLHADEGETSGPRRVSHHEFFGIVGRTLIALLSEVTADGPAFRVDMRLRPFGISGPPVTSLSALEEYFIGHARPWERYAWMKARVVAGPSEGMSERVEPFVYRRYLDYGMLDALRELHGRIAEAARERRKVDDIKVGSGGIREIEFAAQLIQMIRGGREPALRTTSTRKALAVIEARGLMPEGRASRLLEAYGFLRRLEHRLQYYDDQQTQALPRDAEHQAAIAEAMDYPDYGVLLETLKGHRAAVQESFDALFEKGARKASPAASRLAASLFDPQTPPDPEVVAETLAGAGITETAPVATRLIDYSRSRRYRSLSSTSRAKVEKLLPQLVAAAAAEGGSDAIVERLMGLVEAIDRREAYYSLLVENPQVLGRAARLMARSAWAARLLARHPILLDELTQSAKSFAATDWKAERESLGRECAAISSDPERLLDHLRHYKQRQVLRFTIADLEGELPVMALSDELSALADVILDVTLDEAAVNLGFERPSAASGQGARTSAVIPGFCVVAYGKLGGKELGYGSDLDVIFLYDEAIGAEADRLGRVAARVNTWMTALTPAGVLYETDLRLRPDGAKGLMVGSLPAFREYQEKRAWTWEHQALTRARACAGDPVPGARFERLRDEVLATPRDAGKVLADIVAMRARMRAEHRAQGSEIKQVEGGVIDLEFCVQALVLLHGPAHPELRENKGNHTLLHRAGALGLLDAELAAHAADAYLAMRRRAHQAALNDEDHVRLGPDELGDEREAVKRLWKSVFG
jgi:glutamate-ammonia-ligase adenylyltransferase